MASNYPASLDTTTTLPASGSVGTNLSTFPHSSLHGNANDAIIAIETELGTAPSGVFSTVKARLDDIEADVVLLQNLGLVDYIDGSTSDSTATPNTAAYEIPGVTVNFTASSARTYKTTATANIYASSGAGTAGVYITDGSAGVIRGRQETMDAAGVSTVTFSVIETGLSGAIQRQLAVADLAGLIVLGSLSRRCTLMVECID